VSFPKINPILSQNSFQKNFSVFAHRLFRESCVYDRGNYVKDLSKLGREMKRTIIIDNSPASYLFQPQNAIPCSSWFDDKNDTLLKGTCLLKYHKKLLEKLHTFKQLINTISRYDSRNGTDCFLLA